MLEVSHQAREAGLDRARASASCILQPQPQPRGASQRVREAVVSRRRWRDPVSSPPRSRRAGLWGVAAGFWGSSSQKPFGARSLLGLLAWETLRACGPPPPAVRCRPPAPDPGQIPGHREAWGRGRQHVARM